MSKKTIIWLIWTTAIYTAIAYIVWDVNPFNWGAFLRFVFIVGGPGLGLCFAYILDPPKEVQ